MGNSTRGMPCFASRGGLDDRNRAIRDMPKWFLRQTPSRNQMCERLLTLPHLACDRRVAYIHFGG